MDENRLISEDKTFKSPNSMNIVSTQYNERNVEIVNENYNTLIKMSKNENEYKKFTNEEIKIAKSSWVLLMLNFFESISNPLHINENTKVYNILILCFILFEHLISFFIASVIIFFIPLFYYNFYIIFFSVNFGLKIFNIIYLFDVMSITQRLMCLFLSIFILMQLNLVNYLITLPYIVIFYYIIIDCTLKNMEIRFKYYLSPDTNNDDYLVLLHKIRTNEIFTTLYFKAILIILFFCFLI